MSEQEEEKGEKPKELTRARQLINEGKLDEALQLMNNYEEKGEITLEDLVKCHLLKCELFFQQDLYENVVTLAEKTYKESLGLEKKFLSIDALMLTAQALLPLNRLDRAFDIIKQGEELLKNQTLDVPKESKQREANLAFISGYYNINTNVDRALEHFKHSLALRENFGSKLQIAQSLLGIARTLCFYKFEGKQALNFAKRCLAIAEEINNKFLIGWSLNILGTINGFKGDFKNAIMYSEQSLKIFKEINNKSGLAWILNNLGEIYRMSGELDRALECLERSLGIWVELGNKYNIANAHDFLIQILIKKGDLERAQQYLSNMKLLNNQLKDKGMNNMYLFDKALFLKTSLRATKRGKAEKILKKLLKEEMTDDFKVKILLNLNELLLIELRITNDLEVLDEIKPLIRRLLDIAERHKSYWILCETYLLQGKLSLLTFDIKNAKRFLIQAQQIAERFSLNQLASKITNENEDLLKKLDLWEKLKELEAPMADRLELARMGSQIEGMIQDQVQLTTNIIEQRVAIHKEKKICMVCRGEVLRFSYICECGAIYCGNCAQALTNLENMCWVCDTQIDYLKHVKPFKEEESGIVDEKRKNK